MFGEICNNEISFQQIVDDSDGLVWMRLEGQDMPAEGLFGAARLALRVALRALNVGCATLSNPACSCRGFDQLANPRSTAGGSALLNGAG